MQTGSTAEAINQGQAPINTLPYYTEVVDPQDADHASINAQYLSFFDLESKDNINNYYKTTLQLIQGSYVGEGIKKTLAYNCKISKQALQEERDSFWSNTNI